MQPTSLHNLYNQWDWVTKHRKQRSYGKNPTYSIPTIVKRLLSTEDNGFVPIRNDKSIKWLLMQQWQCAVTEIQLQKT